MKRNSIFRTAAAAALLLALTACGGGHDEAAPAPVTPTAADDVPATATASSQAYQAFAASLTKSETARPLDISQTTPPTSETAVPMSL